MTEKVIINNGGIEPIIPTRKQQFFINTWHGGVYKRVRYDLDMYTKFEHV